MGRFGEVRRHVVAIVAAVALVVAAVAWVIVSPSSAQQPADFHGRTWLAVATASGPQLVLVNGISGMIEGRADSAEPPPEGVQFLASTPTSTLLGSGSALTVVDNGHHDAVTRAGVGGLRSVMVGSWILSVGDVATVTPADLDGDVVELDDAPAPVPEVDPVVDGHGRAWYLAEEGSSRVAARLGEDATTTESFAVGGSTTKLVVVDGEVHAAGPSGVEQVDGDDSREVASGADVFPTVAVESGSAWATASGRTVTVFDDEEVGTEVQAPASVAGLAVWFGTVVVTTDEGAGIVRDGDWTPLAGVSSAASLHTDGGLLWVTSEEQVVAIDRDQHPVSFQLAAIDLDVCVGSCEADDISRFLEEQASTTTTLPTDAGGRSPTTTTAPPRDLRPPTVDPTVPTTTTTTVAPRPDDRREPVPTLLPDTDPTTTVAVSTTSTTQLAGPEVIAPDPTPPPSTDAGRPDGPDLPVPTTPPDIAVLPPGPPPTEPPATTPTTTTAPAANGLVLQLDAAVGFMTARVAVTGPARACPGAQGDLQTTAALRWSGSSAGSRDVDIRWQSQDSSESLVQDVTIPGITGGRVDVTLGACRLAATRSVDAPFTTPRLSEVTIAPDPPVVGQPFNAGVRFEVPDGFRATSAAWDGGGCATQGVATLETTETRQAFVASVDRCRISLVVTFATPGGADPVQVAAQRDLVVGSTTTTTTATTSTPPTTVPSTTTSTAPTTATAPTTSTTTTPTTTTTPPQEELP